MTRRELNIFRQDFRKFLLDSIKKYNPSDAELGLMYTSMIHSLNSDMDSWFFNEKEEEEKER